MADTKENMVCSGIKYALLLGQVGEPRPHGDAGLQITKSKDMDYSKIFITSKHEGHCETVIAETLKCCKWMGHGDREFRTGRVLRIRGSPVCLRLALAERDNRNAYIQDSANSFWKEA